MVSGAAYLDLLSKLDGAGVRYAIAGGFAVVLHGVPRMTFDLDLVIDLADDNVDRLVDVLTALGYRPRLPIALAELRDPAKREDWVSKRNVVAFSLHHPVRTMEEIDILLVLPMSWEEIAASTISRELAGVKVVVVGRAVLRAMKLATGREKDRVDAELLEGDDDA